MSDMGQCLHCGQPLSYGIVCDRCRMHVQQERLRQSLSRARSGSGGGGVSTAIAAKSLRRLASIEGKMTQLVAAQQATQVQIAQVGQQLQQGLVEIKDELQAQRLGRERQSQLKNIVFEIRQLADDALANERDGVARWIGAKRALSILEGWGVTAASFEEIADKEYLAQTLKRLTTMKDGVSPEEEKKADTYLFHLDWGATLESIQESLNKDRRRFAFWERLLPRYIKNDFGPMERWALLVVPIPWLLLVLSIAASAPPSRSVQASAGAIG